MSAKSYNRGTKYLHNKIDEQVAESEKRRDFFYVIQENADLKARIVDLESIVKKRTEQTKRVLCKSRRERVQARRDIEMQRKKARMIFQKLEETVSRVRQNEERIDELMKIIALRITSQEFENLQHAVRDDW